MNLLRKFLFTLVIFATMSLSAQVAINTDGSSADGTAILDVKSTSQGLLIPRMSTSDRTDIATPANGLIVFDTDTKSVWFYDFTSTSWKEIYGSNNNTTLSDADGDTKIEVESTPDNDEIRLYNELQLTYVFKQNRLDIPWSTSTLIGGEAGSNTTSTGYGNTALGRFALNTNVAKRYNTAIGQEAMGYAYSSATGSATYNTAVGYGALRGSTSPSSNSGNNNIAIGSFSMFNNTSGYINTALGIRALETNSTGYDNIAIGFSSLRYNNSGSDNIALGNYALESNTTGQYNTAIGQYALLANKINSRSTAIGYQAMSRADSRTITGRETYNTALGYQALRGSSTSSANTGTYNTAIGDASMSSNTSGNNNVAVGNSTLTANTTGNGNTAIGYNSMDATTTGVQNTAVGFNSLSNLTTGILNVALGEYAGNNLVSGDNNIFIGNTDATSSTSSDELNIGNTIYGTGISSYAAKIGIGVASPDEVLDVRGNLQVKNSSGGGKIIVDGTSNNSVLEFRDAGSYGGAFGYSLTNNNLFIYHGGSVIIKNGTVYPGLNTQYDLGLYNQAWDDIWYDDLHNVGAAAFANRIVTAEIINHPPKEKPEASIDNKTKRGQIELDPNSLPDGLHDETSILTDEVATYNYKANYEQQLQINELKKIAEEQQKIIKQLLKLLTE